MIVIATGEPVARFVSEQLGIAIVPPYTTMGVTDDTGAIIGGVVFHCFEGHNVHFTAAGTGWNRAFLKAVGEYVFQQLGCIRMTATTGSDYVAGLACRLGGKVEGVMRNQFGPGKDGILVGILREEWKYGRLPANKRG